LLTFIIEQNLMRINAEFQSHRSSWRFNNNVTEKDKTDKNKHTRAVEWFSVVTTTTTDDNKDGDGD